MSRDEIAASRASISIGVPVTSGAAGGGGVELSEYALPARVRILECW